MNKTYVDDYNGIDWYKLIWYVGYAACWYDCFMEFYQLSYLYNLYELIQLNTKELWLKEIMVNNQNG